MVSNKEKTIDIINVNMVSKQLVNNKKKILLRNIIV